MGQKRISKKELKCIDSHLTWSIKALMRDSRCTKDFFPLDNYDSKSGEICKLLFNAFMLVGELYEEN